MSLYIRKAEKAELDLLVTRDPNPNFQQQWRQTVPVAVPCSPFHSPGSHMSCWSVSEIWRLEAYLDNPYRKKASLYICGLHVLTASVACESSNNDQKTDQPLKPSHDLIPKRSKTFPERKTDHISTTTSAAVTALRVPIVSAVEGQVPTLTWLGPMMVPVQERMNKSSPSSIP